jgi:hypothetical protein
MRKTHKTKGLRAIRLKVVRSNLRCIK